MQSTNRIITFSLIASMAIGWVALWMEWNPRYNTGEAIQKLLNATTKAPETSLSDYQKSQKDTQKSELEAQKKEINAWFEAQKKQIQSDTDAARMAFTEKANALSETEKAAQKDVLYAQYKQIWVDAEAKMKELQSQKEAKMKALELQYVWIQSTDDKPKSETSTAIEAKKKEINAWFEAQKKELMTSFEEQKAYLYSKRNALSEEEKKAQQTTFDEKKKAIQSELEAKKKELQSKFETKMKEIMTQYWMNDSTQIKDKVLWSTDKEKVRQELKDKLAKVSGDKKSNTGDLAQCKTSFDSLRTAKEANAKERKAAWDAFREANKNAKKDIFTTDSREDVKDTLDTMRLQIRLVERKYGKSLVGTSSTVTLEYALSTINTIVQRTRTDLADYVQDWKTTEFNTFRDWFISVLTANKKSLLTLMQSQSQTIKGLADVCKKKAQSTLLVQDSSDKQTQSQLNSSLNWTSVGEWVRQEKKMPPQSDTTNSGVKESSTQ